MQKRRAELVRVVREVQELPYVWPHEPSAAAARSDGVGSCASKHALLREELAAAGFVAVPLFVFGPLVPKMLSNRAGFTEQAHLTEVHECLTVLTPWAGPCRVDISWDPPLIRYGLPGALDWDGASDMPVAFEISSPGWAIAAEGDELRAAKEALRARLYVGSEWRDRNEVLARLSDLFASWRTTR